MVSMSRAVLVLAVSGVLSGLNATQGCEDPTPTPVPPVPPSSTEGSVIVDGQAHPYTIDYAASRLVIRVQLTPDCTLPFHNHAILSTSNAFRFALSVDDPAASTFEADVHAAGLEADLPEIDALYPETAHNSFTDEERAEIEASMNEQLDATTFDTLYFRAYDLTTLYGIGTASVDATIKGITSSLEMSGGASLEPDGRVILAATGMLDGTPYGIYTGFGASCISPLMPLDLVLELVPLE